MIKNIKTLITEQEIKTRITSLADEINKELGGEEIVAICSLKGAVVFATDLIRELSMPLNLEFIEISSYGNETSSKGSLNLIKNINADLQDKIVLLIEDIVDTGQTLEYITNLINQHKPKRLLTCVLLDNPARRIKPITADFTGFKIPNKFVLGYGLDYEQKYRNLPYIGYLEA